MPSNEPTLSICIPTFNRADLLEVCLASVLPQLVPFGARAECVISDNASTDRTPELIARLAKQYTIRHYRNTTNIGIIGNITKVASELARGEFCWLVGDDDVLTQGAVERFFQLVDPSPVHLDLIALNVGYAAGDQRPTPGNAQNGVSLHTQRTLRKSTSSGIIPFSELFEGPCADLTAMYSLAMRRKLWTDRYPKASTDEPFSSVESTYPHAAIIADHMPNRHAGLITEPAIMIYEMPSSQFSWSKHHAKCVLLYCTQLLQRYHKRGVPWSVLRPYFVYQLQHRSFELGDLAFNRQSAGGIADAIKVSWMLRFFPLLLLRSWVIALTHPAAPRVLSLPLQIARRIVRRSARPL